MEGLPPRNPDEEPHGHEGERLWPGEIDLTGVVRQDDDLADVIGDAIGEAEGNAGELPDWGARTLARALANERDDPLDGALHRFAVTGQAEPEAIAHELADLYERTDDAEIREWVNWLGTYVIRMPDRESHPPSIETRQSSVPEHVAEPEAFGARLRRAFAEADARGEAIHAEEAQAVATILALFLDPDSAMARFADTGDANPVLLHQEAEHVRRLTEHTPGASGWIDRFEQHLASRSDLGRQPNAAEPAPPADVEAEDGNPQIEQGIRSHGDAFRAYLQLSDVAADADDLLQGFHDVYLGSAESMPQLLDVIREEMADIASAEGLDLTTMSDASLERSARMAYDIVELNGKLYLFSK